MLTKTTRELLQALTTLSRIPEWREVTKLLDSELAETMEKLLGSHDEIATRKLQGRGKLIRELQTLVATAPEELVKFKQSR